MKEIFIAHWIELCFAVVGSAFGYLLKKFKAQEKEQRAVKLGITALLRDRIITAYNHYMDKGWCPIYARENVDALFVQYKVLGGNGTVGELVEKMKKLPTEEVRV